MVKSIFAGICLVLLTGASLPLEGPLPAAKPERERKEPEPAGNARPDASPETEEKLQSQPETVEAEPQGEHDACLADLRTLGAVFKTAIRVDDDNGCGIDKPIVLSEILPRLKLAPEGHMRCPVALARWMKDSVIPAAKTAKGEARRLTSVNHASAYVCRMRNNAAAGKLSEHARGNAVDIASFSFDDGSQIEIKPRKEDPTLIGAFQRAVTATACLYFSTVLDPESDATHETHLHLDVLKRKGDYRYCR